MSRVMNPFIVNLFKMLMKESGEEIPADPEDARFKDLYALFESLLGKNVLACVPEHKQARYMKLVEDNPSPSMESIEGVLGDGIENPEALLKKTVEDFRSLYFRNRGKKSTH